MRYRLVLLACWLTTPACGPGKSAVFTASPTELLTLREISTAFSMFPDSENRALTRQDTIRIIAAAAYWTWEGQANPPAAVRLYCAALALGVPDEGFYRIGGMALRSLEEHGAEVDIYRVAARKWPQNRTHWELLAEALDHAHRQQEAAQVRANLTANARQAVPSADSTGCVKVLEK